MEEKLKELQAAALAEIAGAKSTEELEAFAVRVLGKKGELTALLRGMGTLPPEQRPIMGQMVNGARQAIEGAMEERRAQLGAAEQRARFAAEALDVTLPGRQPARGSLHPLSIVLRDLIDVFVGMGFSIAEGFEVELDHYNFELLNVPKNHPARDMQDTFYIDDNVVLRTHTSPVQARVMLASKPPIRIVCPGRVYRFDEVDASHSPVFHQMEGLVVDENVTMGDLYGTLSVFVREMYGSRVKTRLRPSYFPFTEPSAEMDISCVLCGGKGCSACKGTGWVEVLGCGMVNPSVLRNCNIDPQKYSGFAFGIGIDRVANMRYQIMDIRSHFDGDARFLKQFAQEG